MGFEDEEEWGGGARLEAFLEGAARRSRSRSRSRSPTRSHSRSPARSRSRSPARSRSHSPGVRDVGGEGEDGGSAADLGEVVTAQGHTLRQILYGALNMYLKYRLPR